MSSLGFFLCVLLVWTKGTWAADPTMPFMEYLDTDRMVCLKWGFDDEKGIITFHLTVNSIGWVGFGLSPNGGMEGSDIVIGGLGPNGIYFTDRHADGKSMPLVDEEQNYTLLSMTETDGQTTMKFQRSIKACDDKDFDITDQPIKLIYAYGSTDDIKYHRTSRGTKEVNLLNYRPRNTPPNIPYISAKVHNITVPPQTTYYHCKLMKLTNLTTKHHIIRVEPDIENLDVVHHMLLYKCPFHVTQVYDEPCYTGNKGDICFSVVAAWAVGGEVFELPENAGIPIGGADNDTLYRLEIHYNNPLKKEDITDNSGLRLYYTDQLREKDVGILTSGMLPKVPVWQWQYNIPPKASEFRAYGICNTSLVPQLVNPMPDLQVFAVLLHTHLAGKKVRVGHFRDGKQIDFLAFNENYDFEMQQVVSLGSMKTIQHRDDITVECTYDTSNRTKDTKMGLSSNDEMCIAFLYYYPAIPVSTCISHPNTTGLSNSSNQTSNGNLDIGAYEYLLKTLPQFQAVSDASGESAFNPNGFIREPKKTPTVKCHKKNTACRLYTTWTLIPGGAMLLLFWIAMI